MSNDRTHTRTETPLQRVRRLEEELTARGRQLTALQAERDTAIAEYEEYRLNMQPTIERLAELEDDDGATRRPLLAALHVFHDRHHRGPFRQCWDDPCGTVDMDRDSTGPNAGPAPATLPLAVVPMMEASA